MSLQGGLLALAILFSVPAQAVGDVVVPIPRPIDSLRQLLGLTISTGFERWLPVDVIRKIFEYFPQSPDTFNFLRVFAPFVRDPSVPTHEAIQKFDVSISQELIRYIQERSSMHAHMSHQRIAMIKGVIAAASLGAGLTWALYRDSIDSWSVFTAIYLLSAAPLVMLPIALYSRWREPIVMQETSWLLGWLAHLQRKYGS